MFGNFFKSVKTSPFEKRKSKMMPRAKFVNELSENGDFIVKPVIEYVDVFKPLTPQSGIGLQTGNISFALRSGQTLDNHVCQLSFVNNTNPLDAFRASKDVVDKFINVYGNKENNENETE